MYNWLLLNDKARRKHAAPHSAQTVRNLRFGMLHSPECSPYLSSFCLVHDSLRGGQYATGERCGAYDAAQPEEFFSGYGEVCGTMVKVYWNTGGYVEKCFHCK